MSKKKAMPVNPKTKSQPTIGQTAEHVIGVGLGAAGGIAAGAVVGAVGGPPGAAVGAVAGALVGSLVGETLADLGAEGFNDNDWQEHFQRRGHAPADYERYRCAYKAGWLAGRRFGQQSFDEVETQLRQQWDVSRNSEQLPWDDVKHAARDAWNAATAAKPPTKESPPPR